MSLPENICGRAVRTTNFVGRARDLDRVWRRLETDHGVLSAPRRVGKTSLMFALQEGAARRKGWLGAAYLTAEGTEDERHFVAELYATVAQLPGCEHVKRQLDTRWQARLRGDLAKLSVGALSLELRQAAPESWQDLAAELQDALLGLPPGRKLLLLVDELPVFLDRLLKRSPERAEAFLAWFRMLRQGRPERSDELRWLVAGSIGLAPLAEREGWSALINDLYALPLDALEETEARTLLTGLSERYALSLTSAEIEAILGRIGWPIPFFIQLVVGQLVEQPRRGDRVPAAFAGLLAPEARKHFAPWSERLRSELGPVGEKAARAALRVCAADPSGARPDALVAALEGHWAEGERDARRRALLQSLEHDGYLVRDEGRYRFRSPLLREFWLDQEGR